MYVRGAAGDMFSFIQNWVNGKVRYVITLLVPRHREGGGEGYNQV